MNTETKPPHTPSPIPWKQHESEEKIYATLRDAANRTVADCGSRSDPQAQANAAFIIRAVNAHGYLLKATKLSMELFSELRRTMDEGHWFAHDLNKIGEALSEAIAKAEGR